MLYDRQVKGVPSVATANRRGDLLAAALEAFVDRGYEGTSVADLALATGLSKAAFVYHFRSKEELLFELAGPLIDELDDVVARYESGQRTAVVEPFLTDYLAALWRHRSAAEWIDGDKSILNHGDLGARLDTNNKRVHTILAGPKPSRAKRARASAILGMLWRPVRNGYLTDDVRAHRDIVELAAATARDI